jgi:hypothetical protein
VTLINPAAPIPVSAVDDTGLFAEVLLIVSVPLLVPSTVGTKVMTMGTDPPAGTVIGYAGAAPLIEVIV